jgi:N-methylhydantoinase B
MMRKFDPILVEVIKNELASITEQMATAVSRTGRSAMLRIGDFAVTVCDKHGRVLGPGYSSPFQLGFFMELMTFLLKKHGKTLKPGDVLFSNDPYTGMGHMPDLGIVTPVFWQGQLVAFAVAYSHHSDIGGRFAGGFSSQCSETYEEGICLPITKIYDQGNRNEPLLETILANVRVPEEWEADMEAKIAGCWRGAQEISALLDKYGSETFESCCDYVVDYAERELRAAILAVPDGDYEHEENLEEDGFGNPAELKLKVALKVRGDTMTVDLTGTTLQLKSAFNTPFSVTKATVYGALKLIVGADVQVNDGFTRPVKVVAPLGTLFNPRFPAAVGGRGPVGIRLMDMMFHALAKAVPEKVPVPGVVGDMLHFSGETKGGRQFAAVDLVFSGWGARPSKDGIDGVAPIFGGSFGVIPAEVLEREAPIVIDQFGYVPDTAGAGKYRGALSIVRQWRFLAPGKVMVRTCRLTPSNGMMGGKGAGAPRNVLNPGTKDRELPLQTHMHLDVVSGDSICHVISGAGGHGNPSARPPELVLADVKSEKVTVAGARAQYGVEIIPGTLSVDWEKTKALRDKPVAP